MLINRIIEPPGTVTLKFIFMVEFASYLQVNTSGIYNITANFKSTDGAITGYVLVIGPQQLVNPPAKTGTGQTNFPYILLSAIAIGVIISSVVIVYTNKKEKGLKTRDSPDGP